MAGGSQRTWQAYKRKMTDRLQWSGADPEEFLYAVANVEATRVHLPSRLELPLMPYRS